SGIDCPPLLALRFHGRVGSSEGWGARGTPRPARAASIAARGRKQLHPVDPVVLTNWELRRPVPTALAA
ncbi:hypothetical protein, partial [Rhizobium mesoamericanum]|uniref:hypothetical protein n=1 Tax=Rhizobium mesoamericanum TaxID=1079800 RepID=UPI00055F1F19